MELAILAQEIDSLTLALVEGQTVLKQNDSSVSPEQYLKTVDEVLRTWKITVYDLAGVIVVTGPGSFTASRVSTTIANTIGFTCGIPVTGIENPSHLSLEELLASLAVIENPLAFALPSYRLPPNITQPRSILRGDKLME